MGPLNGTGRPCFLATVLPPYAADRSTEPVANACACPTLAPRAGRPLCAHGEDATAADVVAELQDEAGHGVCGAAAGCRHLPPSMLLGEKLLEKRLTAPAPPPAWLGVHQPSTLSSVLEPACHGSYSQGPLLRPCWSCAWSNCCACHGRSSGPRAGRGAGIRWESTICLVILGQLVISALKIQHDLPTCRAAFIFY